MSTQIPKQTEESSETETEAEVASKGDERRTEKRRRAAEKRAQRQAEEAEKAAADEDTIELKVFRYDPEVEGKQEPRFDTFHGGDACV